MRFEDDDVEDELVGEEDRGVGLRLLDAEIERGSFRGTLDLDC